MGRSAEVEAWFAELDHPLTDVMLGVRDVILGADRRVDECIKWKSPTFTFRGNIASINPRARSHVSLMFHQGARIPGENPSLEGGGGTARYMRFVDLDELEAKRRDLEAAIVAWCEMKTR